MNTAALRNLAHGWREEADLYRRRGLDPQAQMAESYAAELEERLREWELELLTLDEATGESDYSYSALQKKLASGEIPNAGAKGSPRIRRCDLPLKGGRSRQLKIVDGPDLAGQILNS